MSYDPADVSREEAAWDAQPLGPKDPCDYCLRAEKLEGEDHCGDPICSGEVDPDDDQYVCSRCNDVKPCDCDFETPDTIRSLDTAVHATHASPVAERLKAMCANVGLNEIHMVAMLQLQIEMVAERQAAS